jgi:hypothetical protein
MKKFEPFVSQLRRFKENHPFKPFKVILKDGKSYIVGDRWWFACNDISMVVAPNGGLTKYLKFDEVESFKPIPKRRA